MEAARKYKRFVQMGSQRCSMAAVRPLALAKWSRRPPNWIGICGRGRLRARNTGTTFPPYNWHWFWRWGTGEALNFVEAIRGNAQLTAPIDQGHVSTLLTQLGNIVQRAGHELQIDPKNGHILGDRKAAQFWTREYAPGWKPTV